MTLVLQAAPSGGLDAASIVVVALLAAAVLLVAWASRPSTIARYPARQPAADAADRGGAPLAPDEAGHADH